MPAVGESGKRIVVRKPKKRKTKKPVVKVVVRPSPDAQDSTRTIRARQIARSKPASPDRQDDRTRTHATKKHDAQVVAKNVRESRQKVLRKRGRGAGVRAIKNSLVGPGGLYGPGGPNRNNVVTPGEAKKLRAKGVKVRSLTRTESNDVGATIGVRTVSTTGIGRVPEAVAAGIVKDPKRSIPATLRGGRDALIGIPGALAKIGVDTVEGSKKGDPARGVKKVAKETLTDLERRYGDIDEPGGKKRMADRISKEGAAAEVFDATALAAGTAGAVGRGLGAAAKTGRLGAKAKVVASERPKLRTSGGAAAEQTPHPNIVVAAGQAAKDSTRRKAHSRRVRKATSGDRRVDAVDAEVRAGEVTPVRRRVRNRAQRKDVAQRKGRYLVRQKREQAVELGRGTNRNIAGLSSLERKALKYAIKFGIRDPARAVEVLTAHRARIVAERKKSGVSVPRVLGRTNDDLRAIDEVLRKPSKAFTERVGQVADVERRRAKRVAGNDPALAGDQIALRTYAQQAEHLGVERAQGESGKAFASRVRAEAKKQDLADPGYFPSNKRPDESFAPYAAGGTKAVQAPKTYTGALHRTGREDTRPEALTQGLARNIKRKYNWNLIADNFDQHTFDWSRGKSVPEILDELDKRGIDPNTVALWNPNRFRSTAKGAEHADVDMTAGDEVVGAGLTEGVDNAARGLTPKELATMPEEFSMTGGWSVVPRAVYDEIHADTRPSGKVARGYDVLKGKQSRVLLATSPAWLQFQVASNALLTGLAGTGPRDIVKAQLWWKGLSAKERDAIEPYIGTGAFRDTHQQPKMGAAANGGLVNAWRAFKQTPFFHKPRKALRGGNVTDLNPLDALFRVDAAQNNVFRKSVLYSQVKRDAYRRMGRDVGQMQRIQEQVMDSLTLGPKEQMKAVLRDAPALERHAKHVNDFLGDYMTMTAKERRLLSRSVMFYGYVRFSLRFTFWTMPTKHPVMSSILAQLGRMQTDEVRKLLGGDALPFALGKLYFAKDGKLKSVNVARMNPTMNALLDVVGELPNPKKAVGFLPPMVQSALNQIANENIVFGRDYRAQGKEDTSDWMGHPGREAEDRGRIALNDALGLVAPYRSWEKAATKGVPLGDDSLLWDPRPTEFEDRDTRLGIKRQAAQDKRSTGRRLRDDLLTPFVPQPDRARESTALASARKDLRDLTKRIDGLPQSKKTDDGIYQSRAYRDLLDRQKAARERVNRLQAAGEPAPPSPRLLPRPLTPRQAVEQKREKLRSENPRDEIQRKIRRIRARQDIIREGG